MCERLIGFSVRVCGQCGIAFALPLEYVESRRNDHKSFYCPNGHSRYFPEKNDVERLSEQLSIARKEHNECVIRLSETIEEKDTEIGDLKRSRAHYRGRVARVEKIEESEKVE